MSRKARLWSGILFILLIAALSLLLLFDVFGTSDTVVREAYFPGHAEVQTGVAVLYQKTSVGEVLSVRPGQMRLQLLLSKPGSVERRDILTLAPDSSAVILLDDNATHCSAHFTLDTLGVGALDFTASDARFHLQIQNDEGGQWRIVSCSSPYPEVRIDDSLIAGGVSATDARGVMLRPGNVLKIGSLEILWNEPTEYTLVEMELDWDKVAGLAYFENTQDLESGCAATLSTGFGLARPGIRLQVPSPAGSKPIVVRDDPELLPLKDLDLYASLNEVGSYLLSTARMYQRPNNRYERLIDGLNVTVDATSDQLRHIADSITAPVGRITTDAAIYLSSPEHRHAPPESRLQEMILTTQATIDEARVQLNAIRGLRMRLEQTVDSVNTRTLPRVNYVADDLSELLVHIDMTVREINALSVQLREGTLPQTQNVLDDSGLELQRALRDLGAAVRSVQEKLDGL